MSEKILVPTLGESVTEATVSKWLKSVGENVDSDEPIVELETDKVNVEVPSPLSGVLEKINVTEGQTVEVGGLLGSINSVSNEAHSHTHTVTTNPTVQNTGTGTELRPANTKMIFLIYAK